MNIISISALSIINVVLCMAFVVLCGRRDEKSKKSQADCLAGRELSWWMVGLTQTASSATSTTVFRTIGNICLDAACALCAVALMIKIVCPEVDLHIIIYIGLCLLLILFVASALATYVSSQFSPASEASKLGTAAFLSAMLHREVTEACCHPSMPTVLTVRNTGNGGMRRSLSCLLVRMYPFVKNHLNH